MQGCLLDPSQREVFLQQVNEQLCLFEDKVAAMLQQQYEPQSQVGARGPGWGHSERSCQGSRGEGPAERSEPEHVQLRDAL